MRHLHWIAVAAVVAAFSVSAQSTPTADADKVDLQRRLDAEAGQQTRQSQQDWATQMMAAIEQNWAIPPGLSPDLRVFVKFKLAPTGEVLEAEISHSSGVPLFDQTVLQALHRASPLPLPLDPAAFVPHINICFSRNAQNCSK